LVSNPEDFQVQFLQQHQHHYLVSIVLFLPVTYYDLFLGHLQVVYTLKYQSPAPSRHLKTPCEYGPEIVYIHVVGTSENTFNAR
jgi:hypothetical protein